MIFSDAERTAISEALARMQDHRPGYNFFLIAVEPITDETTNRDVDIQGTAEPGEFLETIIGIAEAMSSPDVSIKRWTVQ